MANAKGRGGPPIFLDLQFRNICHDRSPTGDLLWAALFLIQHSVVIINTKTDVAKDLA